MGGDTTKTTQLCLHLQYLLVYYGSHLGRHNIQSYDISPSKFQNKSVEGEKEVARLEQPRRLKVKGTTMTKIFSFLSFPTH